MNWIFLLTGFVVSIVWFVAAGLLYMNPFSKKISDQFKDHPGIRKWNNLKEMMLKMYFFGVLIPSMIFTSVFIYILKIFDFRTENQGFWYIPKF